MAELVQVIVCENGENIANEKEVINHESITDEMIARMDVSVESDRERGEAILSEFADVFAFGENEIVRTSATCHEIDTGDAKPVRQRIRRQPAAYHGIINI